MHRLDLITPHQIRNRLSYAIFVGSAPASKPGDTLALTGSVGSWLLILGCPRFILFTELTHFRHAHIGIVIVPPPDGSRAIFQPFSAQLLVIHAWNFGVAVAIEHGTRYTLLVLCNDSRHTCTRFLWVEKPAAGTGLHKKTIFKRIIAGKKVVLKTHL